jgi:hypothetical protein
MLSGSQFYVYHRPFSVVLRVMDRSLACRAVSCSEILSRALSGFILSLLNLYLIELRRAHCIIHGIGSGDSSLATSVDQLIKSKG